jgi:hypothetical protein
LSFPAAAQSNKGTLAARERIKSGGGAREKKGNGGGAGEETSPAAEEEHGGSGENHPASLGFKPLDLDPDPSIAREITILPFHRLSSLGTASGTKLVPRGTDLRQPFDLPRSNGQ